MIGGIKRSYGRGDCPILDYNVHWNPGAPRHSPLEIVQLAYPLLIETRRREELAEMAETSDGHAVALLGDYLYVMGGRLGRADRFSFVTGRWETDVR